ncbi:YadA-like family protein [Megasphaera sp.]|uniref:YadA-like family protein n=1 Tax=Megasphaera sp. TaxID=2023260 RepID=UPI002587AE5C|nr:YadA-like family protein [Megasphaera sp.]
MLGYNTDVTQNGGVALGSEAVASTAAGKAGYDPATKDASTDTTGTWKSTLAAVSVGDSTDSANVKTRQITNVAAGFADTDAVNVAQLKKVQTQLDANSVHYFSTNSSKTEAGTNYANDGATGTDSIVIGISSKSDGNNSTVLGNNTTVTGVKNGRNNSIVVGQNIDVDGTHNAVFATDYNNGDNKLTKVFGEQNTVLGVGNLVGYTAVRNGNSWDYTKSKYGSDQNVAVGLTNTVSGGSVVIGTNSVVETLGTSIGHGNDILGSMTEGGQLRIALGNYLTVKGEMGLAVGNSAKVDGDWAIAIGNNNRDETTTTAQGAYAIALGTNAKATNTSALALGTSSAVSGFYATALGTAAKATVTQGVALGSFSTADRAGGILGYDPLTKKESTSNTAAWKSVLGAVSVGGQVNYSDGTTGQATRQITNVAAGSADTDAVNVAQLKQVQQSVSDAVKEGKTTIEEGDNITVSKGTTENSYKITAKDTTLKDSDSALSLDGNKLKLEIEDTVGNKVSGSVELDKIGSAIDTKNTIAKAEGGHIDFTTKANEYGGTEYSLSVVTDGKVEAGNTGIVTGDTVYNETRVAKDGEYVKQANSAGENLSILDSQVKTNTESITNLSSNVTNLNSRVSSLDTRINRVGAGAAALAALHPQDYDPSAKWDFAAGYGNYKSANAVAIGAFYRPTNDVLFSIGTSMGGGENMFNAGVSFKFGSSNEYSNYSKASLAEVVSEQSKQLEAQHSTIEALQSKVEKQEQENQELRAQVQEIMRQLSAQR